MRARLFILAGWILATAFAAGEEPKQAADPGNAQVPAREAVSPEMKAALEKLQMPGVKINLEEWSVDVQSRVCLTDGMLELIACTKDTKEHESIIQIEAKPSHIHTALLLLGARNGSPAMQQAIDAEMTRFRHILPSGDPIGVYLAWQNDKGEMKELPINRFIKKGDAYDIPRADKVEESKIELFPTHTFLFAGSILVPQEDGPKRYICDESGNVISLSTFGDELLCLPDIHADLNTSLVWSANDETLPPVDTKVILRLRPQRPETPSAPKPGQ